MKKFIIYSPSYSEVTGGVIALHKLCDLLNKSGYEAYLYPSIHPAEDSYDLYSYNTKDVAQMVDSLKKVFYINQTQPVGEPISADKISEVYWVNKSFNTPVYKPDPNIFFNNEWVVIYPETTFGNPLRAKNVVRWLLHNPGFHTGKIYYGQNELYFRYSESFEKFQLTGSKTSDLILMVLHLPLDLFFEPEIPQERKGTAYIVRKGHNRNIVHNLENSILIDGKSNREIADIFRSVKTFISYDPTTLYSNLAILCGCQSIVIPIDGITKSQWYKTSLNHGIAYGFEDPSNTQVSASTMREILSLGEEKSKELVRLFVNEANEYFK